MVEEVGLDDWDSVGLGLIGERFDLKCPECEAPMHLKHSKHGLFYGCEKWRDGCKGSHGAYPDGSPLGEPANAATKEERIRAHRVFDRLWKSTEGHKAQMTRSQAYIWMMRAMGLRRDEAHIGQFTLERCRRLAALVRKEHPGIQTVWDRLGTLGEDEDE